MTESAKAPPLLRRGGIFAPRSYDAAARTVELVWSTGATVERMSLFGDRWTEVLEVSEQAVDLSRLNAGAPLLNAHGQDDLADVLGVVERAWIEGGEGRALVRFSPRPEINGILADIEAGIIRQVSVGYLVHEWRISADEATKREIRTAVRWTPFEISLVPVAADAAAQLRAAPFPPAAPATPAPASPAATKEVRMDTAHGAAPPPPAPPPVPVPPPADIAALRALAARSRGALDEGWILDQLERGASLDQAREAALEAMASRTAGSLSPARVQLLHDESDGFRVRAADALAATMLQTAPPEHARDFAGLTLHGLMRQIADRAGMRQIALAGGHALAAQFMARGLHTTSDFTAVLANSANKTLREMFGRYPNTWSDWCEEIDVNDFKQITAASIGGMPEPLPVEEGGPIRYGSIAEESETYSVRERARIVTLSRVALVNDDLRAFQQVLRESALAGYTALRRAVFRTLTDNGTMADGIALFNAAHNNLGTAGDLNATRFGELYRLLAEQTAPARGLDPGETAPALPPPNQVALLVSPAEYRTALELTSALIQPNAVGNALPVEMRQFTTVAMDAFLNTGNQPYYLARRDIRAVEIAYLGGNRVPQLETAEMFDVSGVSFKIMYDFGVKAVTWRTIAANLG
ncbi:MAG: hypothetical protein N2688_00225 [Burkholderiaceae bacterium]|nr:hypothetical protein [Burkholderiaceae bacterium]